MRPTSEQGQDGGQQHPADERRVEQHRGREAALVLVAATCLSVVAWFFHQERTETAVYRQALSRVAIGAATGSITVRTGAEGSSVVVRRSLSWSFGSARSLESVSDGVLDAEARCTGGFGFGMCSVSYDLTVPPGTVLALTSHTGSIEVDNPTGDVTARTSTGAVEVRNARSTRVDASTSTGAVQLTFSVAPQQVRVASSTGPSTWRCRPTARRTTW